IPAALTSAAPATIPLWYFDEVKGLWKEEGVATKTGNNYSGEVSHFSFWNYDVPGTFVQFNCTVRNNAGQPIPNAFVKISRVSNPFSSSFGYTDSAGYVSGAIPDNAQLLLEVYGSIICSLPAYSQTLTTTSVNISLTVTVSSSAANATISGTVTNCNNTPVTNGYVILKNGNAYTRYTLTNGAYNFNQLICTGAPNNVTLFGEDVANLQQSNPTAHTLTGGNNVIPNIQACGVNTQQFFNYIVDGNSYAFTAPVDTFDLYNGTVTGFGDVYMIVARPFPHNFINYGSIRINKAGLATGSTQTLVTFDARPQLPFAYSPPGLGPFHTVNITEYGPVGGFIAGNFTAILIGPAPTNTPYNVTCQFRIKRHF
ncbi:MAG TPA: hypothetical protein VK489_10975, partial [Ferruginibacter sp.]|nr:hypothetical protein [Ferruginibacter sp.]